MVTSIRQFPLPEKFLLGGEKGVRNNRALESLTATSDGEVAFTASEAALVQDGEDATLAAGSPARIVQYDVATGEPQQEFLYYTDPLPFESNLPEGFSTGGLVELLALDRTHLLSMERAFAEGVGNAVRIFEVSLAGADDIRSIDSLLEAESEGDRIQPVQKKLLLALEPPGAIVDNLEGIIFGTPLPDGRQTLILMSDNNFNPIQITQFLIIANPKVPE
ncbi:MAG: esterase-like activity of phytase family protein [Coleofasciculaceae cyanobacterium SM2_3_26]|nr:esterase-like activity of phytase family protein [Coleofasciculaceae cyanobacterium SM2_3_26]